MVDGPIQIPTDIGASQVDETDVAIMTALQEDGRRPFTEIARSLGLSEGTVRQRVARLQRLGIVQIVGVVNPSRLGMRRLVIGVQVRGRPVSGVEKAIREFPEVDYVAVSTGGYDMVLMAACRDDDHVLDLVSERLRKIPGVDGLDVITRAEGDQGRLPVLRRPRLSAPLVTKLVAFGARNAAVLNASITCGVCPALVSRPSPWSARRLPARAGVRVSSRRPGVNVRSMPASRPARRGTPKRPAPKSGEERRPEAGGLDHLRPQHRDAELVGLQLTEQVAGAGSAVHGQGWAVTADASPTIRSITSRTWKAIASSVALARWAAVVPRVMPTTTPRADGSQSGAPSPAIAGTKTTPPASGTDDGEVVHLVCCIDDAKAVAQPLDGRAGDEHRALQRVRQGSIRSPVSPPW